MLHLPSTSELEQLSDSKLINRLAHALKSIKYAKITTGDYSHEQRLYRLFETEQWRRKVKAEVKAISHMLNRNISTE